MVSAIESLWLKLAQSEIDLSAEFDVGNQKLILN